MRLHIKKIVLAAMFAALGVVLSTFAVPIGASKCYPIQHLLNVLSAVFLGPYYGLLGAFCTSLIRNLLGTGSLLAFPGSMIGAFLAGVLYQYTKKLYMAYLGEIVGTGILGALFSYPVAVFVMGKDAAWFTYVIPFLLSTGAGTAMAFIIVSFFYQTKLLDRLKAML